MWISAQPGVKEILLMRRSRFTDAQIANIVREYDAGVAPNELIVHVGRYALRLQWRFFEPTRRQMISPNTKLYGRVLTSLRKIGMCRIH